MDDFSVLKKLAQDANEQFPALEDQWSMVCTPSVGLELLAEIDRLRTAEGDAMTYKPGMENVAQQRDQLKASLSAPESVTAEPAADYDALRKQFLSLRTLANSNARMVSHWRNQCGAETREALLTNAANVSAERDTNQVLSDSLLAAEDERDQLQAEVDRLTQENRLLTEHNEFLASSDSRLAPELRAVKDALGLDFTASVSGEVVPLIERLRKLPTCWTEVLEQSEANDQLLDQVLELSKDAARWRFLAHEWPKVKLVPNGEWFNSDFLEREIDAAMLKFSR
jgi:flagellar biosynthesis regulator FlaF